MKRDLSWINGNNIKNIVSWLSYHPSGKKKDLCPISRCEICKAIFPKIPTTEGDDGCGACPCDAYGVSYVTRVAKQIIKEWENNGND